MKFFLKECLTRRYWLNIGYPREPMLKLHMDATMHVDGKDM